MLFLFGLTNFSYASFPSKESAEQVYESNQKNIFDMYNSNLNNMKMIIENFNLNQKISNDSPLVKIWTPKRNYYSYSWISFVSYWYFFIAFI